MTLTAKRMLTSRAPRAVDPATRRALEVVNAIFQDLFQQAPILDGVLLQDVTLADATAKRVAHTLGRAPRSFQVMNVRGATTGGTVINVGGVNDETFLNLKAVDYGATVTVDLWVF